MLDGNLMNPRELRNAFGSFASGVTIVTMLDSNDRPTGVTVSSFTSLSLDPALCLFSLDRNQVSCRWIEQGLGFNINILRAGQDNVAWQFARPSKDKFDGIEWTQGANGLPVISGALCHFECRKWRVDEGGDHILVIGEITGYDHSAGDPLVFFRGQMTAVAE